MAHTWVFRSLQRENLDDEKGLFGLVYIGRNRPILLRKNRFLLRSRLQNILDKGVQWAVYLNYIIIKRYE